MDDIIRLREEINRLAEDNDRLKQNVSTLTKDKLALERKLSQQTVKYIRVINKSARILIIINLITD